MAAFEDQADSLVATAAEIARLRGAIEEHEILSHAKATLVCTGYDNWDGGIDLYSLMLEVPVPIFATIDDHQHAVEAALLNRVSQLTRNNSRVSLREVVISPTLVERSRPPLLTTATEQFPQGTEQPDDVPSYWKSGHFRLFVSHTSDKAVSAHRLKAALSNFNIAAFVAHDDIEPTKEWQTEIETALRTMDALVAIVSPDFHQSKWCDQEVGIAIGRGRLVIPLRVEADPHGFIGKYQGVKTSGKAAPSIAGELVQILIRNETTAPRLADSLIEKLETSTSWNMSKEIVSVIELVPRLSTAQSGRLLNALEANDEVRLAHGVPQRIKALISKTTPASVV